MRNCGPSRLSSRLRRDAARALLVLSCCASAKAAAEEAAPAAPPGETTAASPQRPLRPIPAKPLNPEPKAFGEPRVLNDTAVDLLDVADAFDAEDNFDVNLRLAFEHDTRSAGISRQANAQADSSGAGSSTSKIARYEESTQRLVPELEIGVFHDLALKLRLPVILARSQALVGSQGSAEATPVLGAPGEPIFSVPFQSPTRSGLEYLAVGIDWGVLSQASNRAFPYWVLGVEARFNVSEPMHACNGRPANGELPCAFAADVDRDGSADTLGSEYPAVSEAREGRFEGGRGPGVSRGTNAFEVHTSISRRIKYIESYVGVSVLLEAPLSGSEFSTFAKGSAHSNLPPIRSTATVGVAVVPWEQIEKFQRISFDFRMRASFISAGRDYSELFDALGSSNAASLRAPQFTSYVPERVYFNGLTHVQEHQTYTLRAQFTWQAGEYVKFDVGGAVRLLSAHLITADSQCGHGTAPDPLAAGPCAVASDTTTTPDGSEVTQWTALGGPNPHYRSVIDEPGRRFEVGASLGFNGFIRASVLF